MKWLQIALLVVAGAMAGAIVMMLMPRTRPALQRAENPPVVAQVEKPSPVAAPEPGAAASPEAGSPVAAQEPGAAASPEAASEPKPSTVPEMAPPTHVAVRPPDRERPGRRPAHTPPRASSLPSAQPATGARNEPGRPAAMPDRVAAVRNPPRTSAPATESRNSGSGTIRTYPEEVSVPLTASAPAAFPALLPEGRQESPTPSATPPARMEQENATPLPPPPSGPHRVTLNAGMLLPVRLVDGLSTERNRPGDMFNAALVQELVADDFVIAERGARVEGRVVAADRGGMTVQLIRLHTSDGQTVAIRTDGFEKRADPASGGDRTSARGSIATDGAGGGTGGFWLTRNRPATLPTDTRITFRLGVPVRLTERTQ